MLEHIGVKGFMAFKDMSPLGLKPIVVLAGANSSGKSALIHALLLLKQSLESRRKRPLSLNGEFLNFSHYSEIVFGKHEDALLEFKLGVTCYELPALLSKDFLSKFFSPAEVTTLSSEEIQEKLRVSYEFTVGPDENSREDILVRSMAMSSVFAGRESRKAELKLEWKNGTYRGTVSIPDPEGLSSQYSIDNVDWDHFLPDECRYSEELTPRRRSAAKTVPLELFAVSELRAELSERLHYLGPVRSEPQRAYFISGERVDEGYRGEYIAQILLKEAEDPVDFLVDDEIKPIGLLDAVNRTLTMMGLPQTIIPVSQEGVVSQLTLPLIGNDRQRVTIADVGYGFSQLVPIIVAGLRANKGDSLIVEQPETHLHPRIQESLADFFILLHRLGKRVIVETHSDHLINGLRVRIAEDLTDSLQDAIQVAFVRAPTPEGTGSSIDLLQFDTYGMIANWPPEFMSDGMKQMQRILHSGVEKRKRKRTK